MTCAVAVEEEGGVWIATDSFLGDNSTRLTVDRPKWFIKGDVLFTYAGDVRAAQTVEHGSSFRKQKRSENDQDYLVGVVAKRVKECHIKGGFEEDPEVDYLIVYRGFVYTLQEGYALFRGREGYAAIGSGEREARGALAALEGLLSGEARVKQALKAVAKHSTTVMPPFPTLFVPKARVRTRKQPSSAG
jgi:ATP-dependent protease HslVU (ClpYQ) peptidase subunit